MKCLLRKTTILAIAIVLMSFPAHALDSVEHYRITAMVARELGFSPVAIELLATGSVVPDNFDWNTPAAHGQTLDDANGRPITSSETALATSKKYLTEKALQVREQLEAGNIENALFLIGYSLHAIQDFSSHQGMTNTEHSILARTKAADKYLKLNPLLGESSNPDHNRSNIERAERWTNEFFIALRKALEDDWNCLLEFDDRTELNDSKKENLLGREKMLLGLGLAYYDYYSLAGKIYEKPKLTHSKQVRWFPVEKNAAGLRDAFIGTLKREGEQFVFTYSKTSDDIASIPGINPAFVEAMQNQQQLLDAAQKSNDPLLQQYLLAAASAANKRNVRQSVDVNYYAGLVSQYRALERELQPLKEKERDLQQQLAVAKGEKVIASLTAQLQAVRAQMDPIETRMGNINERGMGKSATGDPFEYSSVLGKSTKASKTGLSLITLVNRTNKIITVSLGDETVSLPIGASLDREVAPGNLLLKANFESLCDSREKERAASPGTGERKRKTEGASSLQVEEGKNYLVTIALAKKNSDKVIKIGETDNSKQIPASPSQEQTLSTPELIEEMRAKIDELKTDIKAGRVARDEAAKQIWVNAAPGTEKGVGLLLKWGGIDLNRYSELVKTLDEADIALKSHHYVIGLGKLKTALKQGRDLAQKLGNPIPEVFTKPPTIKEAKKIIAEIRGDLATAKSALEDLGRTGNAMEDTKKAIRYIAEKENELRDQTAELAKLEKAWQVNQDKLAREMRASKRNGKAALSAPKTLTAYEATQRAIEDSVTTRGAEISSISYIRKPSGGMTVLRNDGSRSQLSNTNPTNKADGTGAFLSSHPDLHSKVLSGNLPPEAKSKPIEVTSGTVRDPSEIPFGWIVCTCPSVHVGLGNFYNGVQYHENSYRCP